MKRFELVELLLIGGRDIGVCRQISGRFVDGVVVYRANNGLFQRGIIGVVLRDDGGGLFSWKLIFGELVDAFGLALNVVPVLIQNLHKVHGLAGLFSIDESIDRRHRIVLDGILQVTRNLLHRILKLREASKIVASEDVEFDADVYVKFFPDVLFDHAEVFQWRLIISAIEFRVQDIFLIFRSNRFARDIIRINFYHARQFIFGKIHEFGDRIEVLDSGFLVVSLVALGRDIRNLALDVVKLALVSLIVIDAFVGKDGLFHDGGHTALRKGLAGSDGAIVGNSEVIAFELVAE